MKRYCVVYLYTPTGDPGTDYAFGDSIIAALVDFYRRNPFTDILSITKVRG